MLSRLIKFLILIRIIFQSIIFKKKIYILGVPIHGNLGDQAIIYAENRLFSDKYKNYKIIEIPSAITYKFVKFLKKLIGNNDIYIHGGGFLGNLWINEEIMFRSVIQNFRENKIIVLPQTIFFTNDEFGSKEYEISKNIYESHKNLYFILREKYSFDYMKENFPNCNIILKPDMVLYLDKTDFSLENGYKKDLALLCIRNDKEKVKYNDDKIIDALKKIGLNNVRYTDTVISNNVYKFHRKKFLSKKINEFINAKFVVTDRLHGMVFALIAGTPCLVFQNKSYKIIGVYEWIKKCKFIKIHDNNLNYEDEILELLHENEIFDNNDLKKELQDMI